MNLEVKNFLAFDEFKINFSYPKRIVKTSIEGEYLQTKPNFRYKKVNILMGANATGKTSIGVVLLHIFNFLSRKKDIEYLTPFIRNKLEDASFSIDFLVNDDEMYRVICLFNDTNDAGPVLSIFKTPIGIYDSYEKCVENLINVSNEIPYFQEKFKIIPDMGWFFSFPEPEAKNKMIHFFTDENKQRVNLEVLNNVLKTLDSSINEIAESREFEDAFIIRGDNYTIPMQNSKLMENNPLSSGTQDGIAISYLVSSIINNSYGFYFCDEKFTHIQSDVECAILKSMVNKLQAHDQLFFTTHNLEVLDLDFPKHSFIFLKKNNGSIKAIDPARHDSMKKNTTSLRTAVEKVEIFKIAPNLELIESINNISR